MASYKLKVDLIFGEKGIVRGARMLHSFIKYNKNNGLKESNY